MAKYLVVSTGRNNTSSSLMRLLESHCEAIGSCSFYAHAPCAKKGNSLSMLSRFLFNNANLILHIIRFRPDGIFFHVSVAPLFLALLYCKLFRHNTCLFAWDVYPVTMKGLYIAKGISLLGQFIESFCPKLVETVVVPSSDFLDYFPASKLKVYPIWSSNCQHEMPQPSSSGQLSSPLRIGFAGQINAIRGLESAVSTLLSELPCGFYLNLFGCNQIPLSLEAYTKNIEIKCHAYVTKPDLLLSLRSQDFGLASISEDFGQPGFPSKLADYVGAGIPSVYIGKKLPAFDQFLMQTGIGFSFRKGYLLLDLVKCRSEFDASRKKYYASTSLSGLGKVLNL